ncbi:MAG: hypothetical protein GOU97_02015, partial [Nanoarchaeota archaeon]|nr:hypothetical protein [Nanoarchaeota archaeon]
LLLREIAKTSRKVLALSLEPLLIKYVLPASILFTATILLSERFKLKTKHKLILIIILLLIPSLFVLIFERDAINNISSTYLFENQHSEFYGTVSELTPPDLNFLWIGFTYFTFLIPLGIPFFFKKIDFKKAFLLTTFLISTLLVFSAKRYSFIGSAFFVLPAGLFLSWVYKKIGKTKKLKKIVPILPLIFFLPASILSFHYTQGLGFRINDSWLDAFNWMDANLEPGPVLVWWDMGSWEEGTLGWPSYMDSVLGQSPGRITDFSKFLLTNQTLPKWTENASYLILSSDLVNVWGNVEAAANLTLDSSIINFGYEGTNTQTNRAISQFAGRGYTIQVIEELDRTYSILLPDMQLSKTFVKKGNQVTGWLLEEAIVAKKLGASFYVDADQGYGVFFMNDLLESNYVQLMYMESLEGIKPVYYNGNVKVFEIGSTYFESTS